MVVKACKSGHQLAAVGDQLFGVTSTLLGADAMLTSLGPVDDQAATTHPGRHHAASWTSDPPCVRQYR